MLKTHPRMKLSPDEERFLRHWIFDEAHYEDGPGVAKHLQLANGAIASDIASLIAAGIPDVDIQKTAASTPPTVARPAWPWTEQSLQTRLSEAREILAERQRMVVAR